MNTPKRMTVFFNLSDQTSFDQILFSLRPLCSNASNRLQCAINVSRRQTTTAWRRRRLSKCWLGAKSPSTRKAFNWECFLFPPLFAWRKMGMVRRRSGVFPFSHWHGQWQCTLCSVGGGGFPWVGRSGKIYVPFLWVRFLQRAYLCTYDDLARTLGARTWYTSTETWELLFFRRFFFCSICEDGVGDTWWRCSMVLSERGEGEWR